MDRRRLPPLTPDFTILPDERVRLLESELQQLSDTTQRQIEELQTLLQGIELRLRLLETHLQLAARPPIFIQNPAQQRLLPLGNTGLLIAWIGGVLHLVWGIRDFIVRRSRLPLQYLRILWRSLFFWHRTS